MSETNGMPGIPDGPPPGAPGSPEAPITPPPVPPAMPDFGPTKAPEAKPMNGLGTAAMMLWILGILAFVIVAGFILIQVVRGFSADPFGGVSSDDSCVFDHDPTDQELASCVP